MARSNKWENQTALCPHCRRPFGSYRPSDGGCDLMLAKLVLLYVTTLRCAYEDCQRVFTYRPRVTQIQETRSYSKV
jgi:hypothetical protein